MSQILGRETKMFFLVFIGWLVFVFEVLGTKPTALCV